MAVCEALKTTTIEEDTVTISWTSISNTYQWLEIIGYAKGATVGSLSTMYLQLNGDTGSNYAYKNIETFNASWSIGQSGSTTKLNYYTPGKAWGEQSGAVHIYIPQNPASQSHAKSIHARTGYVRSSGSGSYENYAMFTNGYWSGTGDITQIDLKNDAGFVSGTQFTLIGWKDS